MRKEVEQLGDGVLVARDAEGRVGTGALCARGGGAVSAVVAGRPLGQPQGAQQLAAQVRAIGAIAAHTLTRAGATSSSRRA